MHDKTKTKKLLLNELQVVRERVDELEENREDSPNTGWGNVSFRTFADYMQTAEFSENIRKLIEMAKKGRIALMCAETLPWRCHRSLIADALLLRTVAVRHVVDAKHSQEHSLTAWAHTQGTTVTCPPTASS